MRNWKLQCKIHCNAQNDRLLVCNILFTSIFRIKFHDVDRALNDDNKCKMNVKTFKGIISHVTNGNDFHWTLYAI